MIMYSIKNEYGGPYTVRSTVDSKDYVFQVGKSFSCKTKDLTEETHTLLGTPNDSLKI